MVRRGRVGMNLGSTWSMVKAESQLGLTECVMLFWVWGSRSCSLDLKFNQIHIIYVFIIYITSIL